MHTDENRDRLSQRYLTWANTRRENYLTEEFFLKARTEAWHLYCDARDGFSDGTSKERYTLIKPDSHLVIVKGPQDEPARN